MANDIIDDFFAPISRDIARVFFNEKYGRTWSQKVEDENGIPKNEFHAMLIGGAFLVGLLIFGRKD